MSDMQNADDVRTVVRETYGRLADGSDNACCGGSGSGGCGCGCGDAGKGSRALGYTDDERASVPQGTDMGLGCGNPQAIARLAAGETVVDLGSGAGLDCQLAARAVGPGGHVIGVDMTPGMLRRARANARRAGLDNVSFRLGEIEHLPVADASADRVISNCVINLSPDKPAVFAEAFRVLRPGGLLAIADIVTTAELPAALRDDVALYTGCVAGAASIGELERLLHAAGFEEVAITPTDVSRSLVRDWAPDPGIEDFIVAATIEAVKPATLDVDE
jgi:SAM-dependent methyltransferase